eukprot:108886_1
MFREQLIKSLRELMVRQEKEKRKQSQNEKKNQLAGKLAKRPPKEDISKVVKTVNMDDMDNKNDGDKESNTKSGSSKGKAQSMYADYMKKKKQTGPASNKNMW